METLNSILSWTHIISAALSLIFGTIVMFSKKGDSRHQKLGMIYFYAMIVNNVTALFITNVRGSWFFPHYLAVACLLVLIPGILAIKFRFKYWLVVHIVCMVLSYYLLIGGTINETFLHTPSLKPYFMNNSPIFGTVHFIKQLIFIGILIYFLRKYRKFGKP